MKNISYKVDKWINKNKSKFTIPSQTRDYFNARDIIFNEDRGGFVDKAEFKEFFNNAKTKEIAGFKMLFDAMANNHFIKIIGKEEVDGKNILHIAEYTSNHDKTYKVGNLLYIEMLVVAYCNCDLVCEIDFDEFYELIMR